MKWTTVIFAGFFSVALSSQGEVVYQSDFTGTNLVSAGLNSAIFDANSLWIINTNEHRLQNDMVDVNDRGSVYTANSWQSDGGFTLDVTFNQIASGTRFSFGIVDAADTVERSQDWLNEGRADAYGIGLATQGEMASGGDALAFNNGSGSSVLSTNQGNITFNTNQTLSITVTSNSWSYSLNGAPASTGSMTFDTSRSYRFIAYAQRGTPSLRGSYFSNITFSRNESNPRLSGIVATDSGLVISWGGKTGETYTVDRTTNLLMTLFGGITNGIPGVEPLTVYTDTVSSIPEAFYRVIKE